MRSCISAAHIVTIATTFLLFDAVLWNKTLLASVPTYAKAEELAIITKTSGTLKSNHDVVESKSARRQLRFLICDNCFWCASAITFSSADDNDKNVNVPDACPSCNAKNLESMPLAVDDAYKFEHSHDRGVSLEFRKRDRVADDEWAGAHNG